VESSTADARIDMDAFSRRTLTYILDHNAQYAAVDTLTARIDSIPMIAAVFNS
jgi:hypothetical protein